MKRVISVLILISAVSGCASLNSIYRPIATNGKSVTVDIYQRGIFSANAEDVAKLTRLCAEPSPDAMTAFALSAGITGALSNPAGTGPSGTQSAQAQIQAAFASGQNSASVGLRTQSIQLMRDSMYRTCEAFLSGALLPHEVYLLQRRFQNLTVGLLAIEQLTGAVRAGQATLAASSAAGTGTANTDNETQAVATAKAAQTVAQTGRDNAKLKKSEADNAVIDENPKLDTALAAKRKAESASPPVPADIDNASKAYEIEKTTYDNSVSAAETKKIELNTKQSDFDNATAQLTAKQEVLTQAQMRVRASTAALANLGNASVSSSMATKDIGEAVNDIVTTVLNESIRGEGCAAILEAFSSKQETDLGELHKRAVDTCLKEKDAKTTADIVSNPKIPEPVKTDLLNRLKTPLK